MSSMASPVSEVKECSGEQEFVVGVNEVTSGLLLEFDSFNDHTTTFLNILKSHYWYVETIHWSDQVVRIVPVDEVL